jgi:lipoprotein NlpI
LKTKIAFLILVFSGAISRGADTKALLEQALIAEKKPDLNRAVELATQAIQADPMSVEPYFYRGRFYAKAHDPNSAISDFTKVIALNSGFAPGYQQRGYEEFKLGKIEESLKDFDKVIELMPDQAPYHWQRGISLYYAGKFEEGRKQFEQHRKVNPQDVENSVWHFLCLAKEKGLDAARKSVIPIRQDTRIPMMEIYTLFSGKGTEEQVFEAARAGKPTNLELKERLFYAHLYVGLFDDATGKLAAALDHIKKAAADYYQDNYMGDVARVHLMSLQKKE